MLRLYALYKQASAGDVSGDRPGAFDFVGRAKYDAWARLKGTTQDKAQKAYVDLVERLKKLG
jgi:acyl-CoA-binding protein